MQLRQEAHLGALRAPADCIRRQNTAPCPMLALQVVPVTPCRGVEDWPKVETGKGGTFCGGEKLWDSAFSLLKTGAEKGSYGMAINPSSKRSRHQVLAVAVPPAGTA